MMKNLIPILLLLMMTACDQTKKKTAEKEINDIFPVTSFIEGQLHLVDSFQLPTLKYMTLSGKTDTSLISIAEFREIAQDFIKPDINSKELSNSYKETNFADQSINGVVFNYLTENKELEIQRVDVVISADPVMNDKVRSIYMEKQLRRNDTSIQKKLYWRTDKNFQIITTQQSGTSAPVVSIIKVVWDDR